MAGSGPLTSEVGLPTTTSVQRPSEAYIVGSAAEAQSPGDGDVGRGVEEAQSGSDGEKTRSLDGRGDQQPPGVVGLGPGATEAAAAGLPSPSSPPVLSNLDAAGTSVNAPQPKSTPPNENDNDNDAPRSRPLSSTIRAPAMPAPASLAVVDPTKVRLEILLVSGKRKVWEFEQDSTAGEVKRRVWDEWPQDWPDDKPPSPAYLRLLHLGHILDDTVTMRDRGLKPNTQTIVHMPIRVVSMTHDDEGE